MTKDEIEKCVHKNVNDSIKRYADFESESVTKLLDSLHAANSVSSDTDCLKIAKDITKVLYQNVVEQSVFTTICTLFDLGLLNQKKPE